MSERQDGTMRAVLRLEAEGPDAVERIRALLEHAGGRAGLAETPDPPAGVDHPREPVTARSVTGLLERAPRDAGELAAYLARLDDAQLDRVWVAALIDAVLAAGGKIGVGDLARVCNAVRDRYRACAEMRRAGETPEAEDAAEDDGGPVEVQTPAEPQARPPRSPIEELRDRLLAACPSVGDTVPAAQLSHGQNERARLKQTVVARDDRFVWVPGGARGRPPALVRRVKP